MQHHIESVESRNDVKKFTYLTEMQMKWQIFPCKNKKKEEIELKSTKNIHLKN